MNGNEKTVLTEVKNDIKWMKKKQRAHDNLIGKVFDKLEDIDLKFDSGTGKIAHNRENIAINANTLIFHKKLLYSLFGLVGAFIIIVVSGLFGL